MRSAAHSQFACCFSVTIERCSRKWFKYNFIPFPLLHKKIRVCRFMISLYLLSVLCNNFGITWQICTWIGINFMPTKVIWHVHLLIFFVVFFIYFADRASRYTLLVGDQLEAKFFYIIRLFQSSTCFEQTRAHHQEVNCINTESGIVTFCKWPSVMQVEQELLHLHTGRPLTESDYTRFCINIIDLLMMSTCLLETCRGLK